MSAQKDVEQLLDQIRALTTNPVIEKASDQIQVLCRAYMEPDQALRSGGVAKDWSLSQREATYFELLFTRAGQVVTRSALYDAVYFAKPDGPDIGIVDVMICKLRKKMAQADANYWIETVSMSGYRLNAGKCPKLSVAGNGRYLIQNIAA